MSRAPFPAALGAALLLLSSTGCHAYVSSPGPAPEPGQQVRARLTPSGTAWLLENWGRNRDTVEGLFVRNDDDQVVLAAWRADLPARTRFNTSIDTLRLQRRHIEQLQQRRLSAVRTTIAAVVGAGVVALAVGELAGIGGEDGEDDDDTPFLVVPLAWLLNR